MDLTRRLADAAVRRVAVLLVPVPGWSATRCAAERVVRERGWRPALSAADADVMVICGAPGVRLTATVDLLWEQLPGPRARVTAMAASAVGAVIDQAVSELLDTERQRRDAVERSTDPAMGGPAEATDDQDGDEDRDEEDPADPDSGDEAPADQDPDQDEEGPEAQDSEDHGDMDHGDMDHGDMDHGDMDHGDMDHGDMDHGDMDHGDMDHGDMDHGDMDHGDMDHGDMDHGDMDHGDMDMAPGGIPLAEGGEEDRDGLDLDVLHVPLGPVLPCWPAGLLLHCTLSGDVVTDVRPEVLGAAEGAVPEPLPFGSPADRLDRAAQLLTLAGWEAAATDAARLRDDLLAGDGGAAVAARLDRLAHRVRRSRLLRWSLRGAGPIDAGACRELGLDEQAAGDVHDRLVALLTDARRGLDGGRLPEPVPVGVLARLVPGLELGAVRLLVASLDLDATVREPEPAETR